MSDADALLDQIAFAVAELVFGQHPGNHTINKRVVEGALRHVGVDRMISHALSRPSQLEPFPHPDAVPSFDGGYR